MRRLPELPPDPKFGVAAASVGFVCQVVGIIIGVASLTNGNAWGALFATVIIGFGMGFTVPSSWVGYTFLCGSTVILFFAVFAIGAEFGNTLAGFGVVSALFFGAAYIGRTKTFRQPSLFGSSRWASVADARSAGMLRPGGAFLGSLSGRDLFQHGEDSILTIAPQGSGKSQCCAIPTLLTYPGSVIVTDPKGELTYETAEMRRRMGQRVIVLNPFHRTLAASGLDLGDDGFNPLSFFPPGGDTEKEARSLTSILAPEKPNEDDYFAPASRELITALVYFVLTTCKGEKRSLGQALRLLNLPPRAFMEMIETEWLESDDDTLIQMAGSLLNDFQSPRTVAGIRKGASNALSIYRGELADHVSRGALSRDILKREAVTIYIVLPGDDAEAYGGWFRLVSSVLCQAVGRPGPRREVLFLCDEFANLGMATSILRSLSLHRSAGLKGWLLVQNLGQLQRLYGEGWKEIFSLCRTKQFFAVPQVEAELAEMISKGTGDVTVMNPSWDTEEKPSMAQAGVPLIRASDVPRLPNDEQIIFNGNLAAIKAKLVPAYARPEWKR